MFHRVSCIHNWMGKKGRKNLLPRNKIENVGMHQILLLIILKRQRYIFWIWKKLFENLTAKCLGDENLNWILLEGTREEEKKKFIFDSGLKTWKIFFSHTHNDVKWHAFFSLWGKLMIYRRQMLIRETDNILNDIEIFSVFDIVFNYPCIRIKISITKRSFVYNRELENLKHNSKIVIK